MPTTPTHAPSDIDPDQFEKEVFPAELRDVLARRSSVRLDTHAIDEKLARFDKQSNQDRPAPDRDALASLLRHPRKLGLLRHPRRLADAFLKFFASSLTEEDKKIEPSAHLGLVGLALSGGGIRSASFNLGILQSLYQNKALREIDYLSTLSGGGYIGSTLSAVLSPPNRDVDKGFDLGLTWGEPEGAAVRHLRTYSNYLAPGGFADRVRIPALMLRGIVINLVLILPFVALLACATVVYGHHPRPGTDAWTAHLEWTRIALVILAAWVLISPWIQRLHIWLWATRHSSPVWRWISRTLLRRKTSSPEAPAQSTDLISRDTFESSFGWLLLATAFLFLIEIQPHVIGLAPESFSLSFQFDTKLFQAQLTPWAAAISALLPFLLAGRASRTISKLRSRIVLYALGLLGPLILWVFYVEIAAMLWKPGSPWSVALWLWALVPNALRFEAPSLQNIDLITMELIVYVSVAMIVFGFVAIDVNRTSLHSFYRDRLSRAFLFYTDDEGKPVQDGSFDGRKPPDELKLSELSTSAPYHLLNATLNLQQSKDTRVRHRQSDFFILSRRYVGGPQVGYCK